MWNFPLIRQYIVSLNYEYLNLDDINLYNFYASVDYKFNTQFNPYIGISLGVSNLKWKIDPLTNSQEKDNLQSSVLYGIQAGTLHPLKNQWSLYTKASYHFYDHETKLISTPAQATINHKDKFAVGVGVRYSF